MEKIYLLSAFGLLTIILFRFGVSIVEMRKVEPRVGVFIFAALIVLILSFLITSVLLFD